MILYVCGKIFKHSRSLSCHVSKVHRDRKQPSCEKCHRVFFDLSTLRKHIDTAHSANVRPRLPCTVPGCDKTYLSKGDVVKHERTEHAQNPIRFPCTLCGKEFKTNAHLQRHIHTHTTEKTYTCATCGRGFALMENRKRHEKTHLEKSTRSVSKCDLCPQTFLSRSGLLVHVRTVHENQRNYPCAFCARRFPSSSDLKRHVVARHGTNDELIHFCDKCEYKSHSKVNLANH
ncbi:zinc finger protein 596-like [Folsomia candida]|uniref:zinc finger protein 596-like n=1 Tax=Folsomia candida TaxID=158441 RepID=UPI001604A43F|nr:zinc finger protein 596-like [Folsomia candida]